MLVLSVFPFLLIALIALIGMMAPIALTRGSRCRKVATLYREGWRVQHA